MLRIKKSTFALVLTLLFATGVYAEDAKNAGLNPWTDCGIGAMVFPKFRPLAAISNVIWDLGTTAITSALSSENTCEGSRAVAAAFFINETYSTIEEQTVKGEGDHISAVLNIVGCSVSDHDAIIGSIQNDFSSSLQDPAYAFKSNVEKAQTYYDAVISNTSSCEAI